MQIHIHRYGVRFELSWWALGDSNPRPPACDADALPTELNTRSKKYSTTSHGDFQLFISLKFIFALYSVKFILIKKRNERSAVLTEISNSLNHTPPKGMQYRGVSFSGISRIRLAALSSNAPIVTAPRPLAAACRQTFCAACPASICTYVSPLDPYFSVVRL